jgi:hypothetical protein
MLPSAQRSIMTFPDLHPQYVTDCEGRKTAVILSIEEYHELLEDLADLAVIAERRGETTVPHYRVVAELNKQDNA